jgi:hypothetical protein
MEGHVEDAEKPETATAVNDVKLDSIGIKQEELVSAAKIAADEEVNMSIWEAFKLYTKATLWSVLLSTAVVMEDRIKQEVSL